MVLVDMVQQPLGSSCTVRRAERAFLGVSMLLLFVPFHVYGTRECGRANRWLVIITPYLAVGIHADNANLLLGLIQTFSMYAVSTDLLILRWSVKDPSENNDN